MHGQHNGLSRFVIVLTMISLSLAASSALAQFYDRDGLGVRSAAMGGAGIAAAQNGEAIHYNPALLGLSEDWTITLAGETRSEDVSGSEYPYRNPGSGGRFALHQASLVVPVNHALSFGVLAGRTMHPVLNEDDWEGGMMMYSFSVGVQPHEHFCLGAAFNIWTGSYFRESSGSPDDQMVSSVDYMFQDTEVTYSRNDLTFGMAVPLTIPQTSHQLTFAGMFRPGINLESKGGVVYSAFGANDYLEYDRSTPLGTAYGLGIKWRGWDRLTVAADGEWRYDHSINRVYAHPAPDGTANLQGMRDRYESDTSRQFRVGAEYLIPWDVAVINLRGGYRYHELPISSDDDPNVVANVFTGGLGVDFDHFSINAAYENEQYEQSYHYWDYWMQQSVDGSREFTFTTFWLGMTVAISDFF
ncbi:hypothetical protein KQI52_09695 [bacterium]|nr:hypothetical protein [bacterium]